MDFYKNVNLFIIAIMFIIYLIFNKLNCPCNVPDEKLKDVCYRNEFYGVQLNHLYFYILLGYLFPDYLITMHILGLLWEIIELYLDKNDAIVLKYNLGGCLKINKTNNPNIVGKNHNKYLNPVDKFLNIKNSKIHGWHFSIAEILLNIVGFEIGRNIFKFQNSNK
tara:strand:+ start:2425 stop:2919 length:495 start_codon:yes stop_codon:yes gene_type:complete